MNKIYHLFFFVIIIALAAFPFSCEKTEIKPEQEEIPIQEVNTSYNIIGSWVLCGMTYESNEIPDIMDQEFKDTIKFYPDGEYVYIRGDYYEDGSSFVDNHFYECAKNFLILYDSNNDFDYTFQFYEIAFIENGTQLLLFDWVNTPPTNFNLPSNRRFRKLIDYE